MCESITGLTSSCAFIGDDSSPHDAKPRAQSPPTRDPRPPTTASTPEFISSVQLPESNLLPGGPRTPDECLRLLLSSPSPVTSSSLGSLRQQMNQMIASSPVAPAKSSSLGGLRQQMNQTITSSPVAHPNSSSLSGLRQQMNQMVALSSSVAALSSVTSFFEPLVFLAKRSFLKTRNKC